MISATTNSGLHKLLGNNVLAEFVCPGQGVIVFSVETTLGDSQVLAVGAAT